MIALALEFASPQRSVAVVDSVRGRDPSAILANCSDEGSRSVQPLQLVEAALERARVNRDAVEMLVVGLGPGSYTGIRSAIALAQGWQLANPVKLTGVSTAECLAAQAHRNQWHGPIRVVIDAQRGEFYVADYEISATGWSELRPLRLMGRDELMAGCPAARRSPAGAESTLADSIVKPFRFIGPEVTRWISEGQVLVPEAGMLGILGLARTNFVSGETLEPIYLRQTAFVKAPPPRVE